MNGKIFTGGIFLATLVFSSVALGVAPLGPPTAGLRQGQFGTAVEYAYSDADLELSLADFDTTVGGVQSNTFLVQPGYGLTDDWEIYAILGGADLEMDGVNCDSEFAYGFGTKITFSQYENISYGLLFELGWRKGNGNELLNLADVNLSATTYSVDIKYHEITVALGATWKAAEGVKVYGGPFFYVLEGEVEVEGAGVNEELDLDGGSMVGGYVGAEMDLCPNTTWYGEFQFTGDVCVLGTGVSWKF
jgi:hypothetical protein